MVLHSDQAFFSLLANYIFLLLAVYRWASWPIDNGDKGKAYPHTITPYRLTTAPQNILPYKCKQTFVIVSGPSDFLDISHNQACAQSSPEVVKLCRKHRHSRRLIYAKQIVNTLDGFTGFTPFNSQVFRSATI